MSESFFSMLSQYAMLEHKIGTDKVYEYVIPDEDKQKVLEKMYPFEDCPTLEEKMHDGHEKKDFVVKDFKVIREDGDDFLASPYFFSSGGTVDDWFDYRDELDFSVRDLNPSRNKIDRSVSMGYLLWEYVPDENRHRLAGIIDFADGMASELHEDQAEMFYDLGKLYRPAMELPHENPDIE